MTTIDKGSGLKDYEEQKRILRGRLQALDSKLDPRLRYAEQHNLEEVINEIGGLIKCGSVNTYDLRSAPTYYDQPWKDNPAHVFIYPTNNHIITEVNVPKEAEEVSYETIAGKPQLSFSYRYFTFYVTGLSKK